MLIAKRCQTTCIHQPNTGFRAPNTLQWCSMAAPAKVAAPTPRWAASRRLGDLCRPVFGPRVRPGAAKSYIRVISPIVRDHRYWDPRTTQQPGERPP